MKIKKNNNLDLKEISKTQKCNTDTSLENVLQAINTLFDKHAPLKQLTKREIKTKSKPWLTTGILKSILHIKNKIYNKFYIKLKTITEKKRGTISKIQNI